MMYVGFLLLAIAVAAVVVGFLQRSKMKTILAAPFKPTGHALGSADAKGLVSFQGDVQPAQQLIAPCSGQACLYYEIEIKQDWEKHVQTEDGMKKQTGTDSAHTEKQGSMFYVNDGSGPVPVNATEGVDAKLDTSFDQKQSYGWGNLSFGGYHTHINHPSGDGKHATGTRCVEKIIPAQGNLFVLGKVENNVVTKREGLLGRIMLAREGRDGLLGSTKRNMIMAFVAAGLLLPGGTAMAVFGDAPTSAGDSCVAMENDIEEPCLGRMYDADDVTYQWTVSEEADYTFSAIGTGKDSVMRLWPEVEVRKGSDVVFSMKATNGDEVKGSAHFEPGTYTIAINDTHYGWAENLEGGAGFSLEIDQVEGTQKKAEEGEAVAANDSEDKDGDDVAEGTTPAAKVGSSKTTTAKSTSTKTASTKTADDKADDKADAETEEKAEAKPAEAKAEEKPAEEKKAEPAKAEDKPADGAQPAAAPGAPGKRVPFRGARLTK